MLEKMSIKHTMSSFVSGDLYVGNENGKMAAGSICKGTPTSSNSFSSSLSASWLPEGKGNKQRKLVTS